MYGVHVACILVDNELIHYFTYLGHTVPIVYGTHTAYMNHKRNASRFSGEAETLNATHY